MAKADDTSSTRVRIWLREALELAVAALGSVALAKERLIEWLAAGKLPWSCVSWEGLDAEGIKNLDPELRTGPIIYEFPSVAYHEGDPKFWGVFLHIDWEDNVAVEPVLFGARARGIKLSRTQLLALLPATPQDAPAAASKPVPSPDQRRKAGAKPKYDWDAIQAHCHQWFDDNGYPENVSKLCRDEIIPWCEQRYGAGGTPDMETLRAHVTRWIAASQRSLLPK